MRKHISKFEDAGLLPLAKLLMGYNLTVADLNKMIENLEEYKLDPNLKREMQATKDRDYRDLRKWKLDSFLNRYEKVKQQIERADLIQDYLLELTDNGYRVKVDLTNKIIVIYTKGVNKPRLDRITEVCNFLQHLNNTHRIHIDLLSIEDTNEFRVSFDFEDEKKKAAQDEDEDYAQHRTETEYERDMRMLLRRNFRQIINDDDESVD